MKALPYILLALALCLAAALWWQGCRGVDRSEEYRAAMAAADSLRTRARTTADVADSLRARIAADSLRIAERDTLIARKDREASFYRVAYRNAAHVADSALAAAQASPGDVQAVDRALAACTSARRTCEATVEVQQAQIAERDTLILIHREREANLVSAYDTLRLAFSGLEAANVQLERAAEAACHACYREGLTRGERKGLIKGVLYTGLAVGLGVAVVYAAGEVARID